jgi:carboxymethylenebutenolidase
MHFGETDHIATLEHAGALRAAQGARVEIQVYPAGHGFGCDETPNYHAASAELALHRTLDVLAVHSGATGTRNVIRTADLTTRKRGAHRS